MKNPFLGYVFIFVISITSSTFGQQNSESFGKNRVQFQQFSWSIISTDNFDIYYYPQSKAAALMAAKYAEFEFDKITDLLGYAPYSRVKLIVYATHSDLIQSNIGLATQQVFIGGYAVFLKNRVEVAYTGVQVDFRKEISKAVSQMILNEMMFGNGFSEVLKSSYFLSLPEWYLSGLVTYIAEGWSTEMDDKIRDIFNHRKFRRPNNFTGSDATTIGHSVWNYIAEKYGKAMISEIINYTRYSKKYESSFSEVLSLPYRTIMHDWRNYYKQQAAEVKDTLKAPTKDMLLVKQTKDDTYYGSIRISPDGTRVAWVQNKKGRYKVLVKNLITNKTYVVYRGGYRSLEQKVDYGMPVVAWRNNDKVGVISVKQDKMKLVTYDIKKEIENTSERFRLEVSNFLNIKYAQKQTYRGIYKHFKQLNDFSFSEDGATILISGENVLGQSDIFYYNLRNNNITPITNDIYDDRNPVFMPKSVNSFVFNSNRTTDSLNPKQKGDYRKIPQAHDIFYYSSDSSKIKAKRLTDSKFNEIAPKVSKNGDVYFLSDKNGIYELYKFDRSTQKTKVMSDYRKSFQSYDVNAKQSSLAFIMEEQGKYRLYLDTNFKSKTFSDTLPKTTRQQMLDNMVITYATYAELSPQETKQTPVITRTELIKNRQKAPILLDSTDIDVDNYVFEFEKEAGKFALVTDTSIKNSGKRPPKKIVEIKLKYNEIYISSPVRYRYDFGIDNIVTSPKIEPLKLWGLQMAVNMSDIMANHRINGYFFGSSDFRSSYMSGEYEYLKFRTDFKIKVSKDVLFINQNTAQHRYSLYKYEGAISYPLNPMMRVSVTPFYARTVFQNLFIPRQGNPNSNQYAETYTDYLGATMEYNYDNTRNIGVNMMLGTRIKAGMTQYQAGMAGDKSFGKFYLDIRNYTKVHREIIFAQRFNAGSFVGNYNVNFFLGGMDNWAFIGYNRLSPESNSLVNTSANQDNRSLLFADFVTNVRGFQYGKQFGKNFLIYNAEIRVPIIRYLVRRQIGWSFFRNFMLTGFYDVGLAWTGRNPLNSETNINTTTVNQSPFSAVVTDYRNPVLSGYGFGLRSMIAGYYTKVDFAWGTQDFVLQPFLLYVTLGYDF
ncbi:MAG: LpqB family beta-propeller domain-containing protein [Bacteroidota bacterium]|nr:LpqB family beta-propeller domain-containing protein [Bacteroidota bacterium]